MGKRRTHIVFVVAGLLIAGGIALWYFAYRREPMTPELTVKFAALPTEVAAKLPPYFPAVYLLGNNAEVISATAKKYAVGMVLQEVNFRSADSVDTLGVQYRRYFNEGIGYTASILMNTADTFGMSATKGSEAVSITISRQGQVTNVSIKRFLPYQPYYLP